MNELSKEIFEINADNFEKTALKVFQFQFENNPTYNKYCKLINRSPLHVDRIEKIPFIPISFFKSQEIKSTNFNESITFSSSGTTSNETSLHHIKNIGIYEKSFKNAFELEYGKIENYTILALLPNYLERKGSSLVYMVDKMIAISKSEKSGFYLYNHAELKETLNKLAETQEKTLLIGVSFALLDFVERFSTDLNKNLIVMETGGMKGKRKELIRTELHEVLQKGFVVKTIHSEYGMTELLSQAYSKGLGKFDCPPWMKILIRNQDDPFNYCSYGETGGINVIDLANLYSCSFIQTDDLGNLDQHGFFEVLGRFDQSDIRGCNLLVF